MMIIDLFEVYVCYAQSMNFAAQSSDRYTGFPRSCNNTVQTDLRTRKIISGKFDSSQA